MVRAELAFSQERFDAIGITDGFATAVHWDFAFIPAYVLLLALLAGWAGSFYRLESVRSARYAVVLAVVAAGLLDVVENVAMLQEWWPVAATAAWGKFAILVAVVGYVWIGFLSWLMTPRWLQRLLWQGPDVAESKDEGDLPPRTSGLGIALSGGGIRAASISLGALQTLERESHGRLGAPIGWGRAVSVTAVSGGSNIAAGWSLSRSWKPASGQTPPPGWTPPPEETRPWARAGERAPITPEERHLMDNLGYLLSNNPRADERKVAARQPVRPSAYATVLAGFLLNAALLLVVLWLVVRPLGWLFETYRGWQGGESGDLDFLVARPSLIVPALSYVGLGLAVLLLWVDPGGGSGPDTSWWVALGILVFVYLVFSPEQWSLAAFYRGKLRLAYALYRTEGNRVRPFQNSNIAASESEWEPELSEIPSITEAEDGTPLVICATTTTSSRQVRTHYNIPAMSVTFDPGQVRVFVPQDDHGV